jgi:hypothetical protein
MTTYTLIPDVIHGVIIQYLRKQELINLRSVSKQGKKLITKYGKILFTVSDILKVHGITHRNNKRKLFKKIIFEFRNSNSLRQLDIDDIIDELEVNNIIFSSISISNCTNRIKREFLFSRALKVNTSLQSLYLNNNHINSKDVIAIAEALKVNTSLRKLYISNNYLGSEGANALGEALKVNTSLHALDISDNNIKSGIVLAEALEVKVQILIYQIIPTGTPLCLQ